MADEEEDNIFEDEQDIIDYAEREVESGDELSSVEDEEAAIAKKEKKEKKKRKFSEMKERRIAAQAMQNSQVQGEALDAESQFHIFMKYFDHGWKDISIELSEDDFLPLSTKDATKDHSCFVNAIDTAVPSRPDLFKAPDISDGCCSPMVIIICSGARRGCDIISSLSHNFKCKIGKLFAKHFRINDQIEILKTTHFPLAVGTPNRLHKLMEMGALSLNSTSLLIVDLNEDAKGFNVMNLSDTRKDFYSFVSTFCVPEKNHLKIACINDSSEKSQPTSNKLNIRGHGKRYKEQLNNKKRRGIKKI